MIASRKRTIIVVLSGMPLLYFGFPFLCGFLNLSQGWLMLLAPVLLFGPIVASIIVAASVTGISTLSRIGFGVAIWMMTVALFFVFPAGAKTWTLGFASNFRLTKHPTRVQAWAVEVLDRYEAGQLLTSTNAPYWAAGKPRLHDSEIPEHIRRLWWDKPSIGIVTMTPDGWITGSSSTNSLVSPSKPLNCVAFSWYLTGILVGRPDFRSTWNPWYIHEIIPGVYAFSGMK